MTFKSVFLTLVTNLIAMSVFTSEVMAQENTWSFPDFTDILGLNINQTQDEDHVPFKCPTEKIRNAYENLVNPDDALVALAIEKQTLAICRESQRALIQIAENEKTLRNLFEPIVTPVSVFVPPETESQSETDFIIEPLVEPESESVEPESESVIFPISEESVTETEPVTQTEPIIQTLPEFVQEHEPVQEHENSLKVEFTESTGIEAETEINSEFSVLEGIEEEPDSEIDINPIFIYPQYEIIATMKDPYGWKTIIDNEGNIFTLRIGDYMSDGTKIVDITHKKVDMLTKDEYPFYME